MSLNAVQRARTADEFTANLAEARLTQSELASRTGLDADRFASAFAMEPGTNPVDAWLIRDTLETAVRDAGGNLAPFTVLTEQARSAARGWFGVMDRR